MQSKYDDCYYAHIQTKHTGKNIIKSIQRMSKHNSTFSSKDLNVLFAAILYNFITLFVLI